MQHETIYKKNYKSKKDFPSLSKNIDCDIVVVGAGLAGLVLSHELGKKNIDVVLIEANRIGDGASGINGGFCSPGWSSSQSKLIKKYGQRVAQNFNELSVEGLKWVKSFENTKGFESFKPKSGTLNLSLLKSENSGSQLFKEELRHLKSFEFISKSELQDFVFSKAYNYGILSTEGFHFNPLEFLNALKIRVHEKSVRIFENTQMIKFLENSGNCNVDVSSGYRINCKKLVLAGGGYAGSEIGALKSLWLPIRTFIGTTSPLPGVLNQFLKKDLAFSDDRRAGNYYRKVGDQRLLWGRGISAMGKNRMKTLRFDIYDDIRRFYPDLVYQMKETGGFSIEYTWAGKMAYSFSMMPYVGAMSKRVYSLTGFGGHGMNTAPISAILLAEHLLGSSNRISIFKKIPRQWNGWIFGAMIAEAHYALMNVKDQYNISKAMH